MDTQKFLMISTHYPPYHLGGDAVFVDYLSRELVARGHEVHVYFNPAAYELLRGQNLVVQPKPDIGPQVHPYSSATGRMDPFVALSLGLWGRPQKRLEELIRITKPDVVHWHNPRGFVGRPFAVPGSVTLYTTHDYTPVCPRSNLLKPDMRLCDEARLCTLCCMRWRKPPQLWRIGRRRVFRFPQDLKVISPSEFVARRLEAEGVAVHKVLRCFVPDLGKHFHREGSTDDTIFYLGLLEMHKGVHTLLDAFAKSSHEQGFRLYIVGEGTLKESLRSKVAGLGLSERVSIPGFLDRTEVETVRRNAVAQVVPSVWYENAPSVVLEAFSLGIPVIASNIGGLPELVTAESGSRTFRPGDSNELAELLIAAWRERGNLSERRRQAREAYLSRFRPEIHVAAYLQMIEELQAGERRERSPLNRTSYAKTTSSHP